MARAPSLRRLVESHLADPMFELGFAFAADGIAPIFRRQARVGEATAVQIAEFQAGVKMASFGKFTVNMGVYSPKTARSPARRAA